MRRKSNTVGSLALEQKPRLIEIPPVKQEQTRKLRVAAYARVSSDSEDQLHSFTTQTAHYTELIHQNPDWEFVDVYADKGITGTSAEKRDDFQRLLTDCRRGRIDKILVKSSSRFARNTKESLEAVRELKALGIAVCFEEENIDTSELSGELLTAIFAMLSQKESESISERMRWSYQVRMQSGKFITCKAPFGYRLVSGQLIIEETEAEIVRLIFNEYLAGKNMTEIAAEVTSMGHPTRDGSQKWSRATISYILQNEKYSGDLVLQKRYTSPLPFKELRNKGARAKYLVKELVPQIIDKEVFQKAQALQASRRSRINTKCTSNYPLALHVKCSCCQSYLQRRIKNHRPYWVCRTHDANATQCSLPPIPESEIYGAFIRIHYKLRHQGIDILKQLIKDLQAAREARMLWSIDIVNLNSMIADIVSQDRLLAQLKQQGLVDPDLFISRRDRLAEQLRTAKLEKERLLEAEEDQTIKQTLAIMDALESGPDLLAEFDEELFSELVEKIIVEKDGRLRFHLINGLELTEQMERTVR